MKKIIDLLDMINNHDNEKYIIKLTIYVLTAAFFYFAAHFIVYLTK